jgi:hypothetical protein
MIWFMTRVTDLPYHQLHWIICLDYKHNLLSTTWNRTNGIYCEFANNIRLFMKDRQKTSPELINLIHDQHREQFYNFVNKQSVFYYNISTDYTKHVMNNTSSIDACVSIIDSNCWKFVLYSFCKFVVENMCDSLSTCSHTY